MNIDHTLEPERPEPNELTRGLLKLRQQIVASGVPLLTEDELDKELAERRGEQWGVAGVVGASRSPQRKLFHVRKFR